MLDKFWLIVMYIVAVREECPDTESCRQECLLRAKSRGEWAVPV